jgi:two-component system sensor histidine kinase KdpD
MARDVSRALSGILATAAVSVACTRWLNVTNPTTAALTLLLIVLLVAATSRLWAAVVTSVAAMLCFNFFFLPPVGTFTIADPQNWVALFVFLAVSVVASDLSAVSRDRAREAVARRDEMSRLFDLSRDILLTTEGNDALSVLARAVARRFDLDYVAICRPAPEGWDVFEGGGEEIALDRAELSRVFAASSSSIEYDALTHAYGRYHMIVGGRAVTAVPLRLGARAVGLLAISGRSTDVVSGGAAGAPGVVDAVGGLVAIAMERAHFLDELKAGELARQSEALKSALLASIAHDLRTPLTAIRVAAGNLQAEWLSDAERREQNDLVLAEVGRLSRLFENILEMARIDAGAIEATKRWAPLSEIVEAGRDQSGQSLERHVIDVQMPRELLVRVDPRLTSAALAHLLENAAQHAPDGSTITVTADAGPDGLVMTVRDRGAGIAAADLPHLFERFYRGASEARRAAGTGMGLSIARGLLAAESGRVWAENCADGGARFAIAIPADSKLINDDLNNVPQ